MVIQLSFDGHSMVIQLSFDGHLPFGRHLLPLVAVISSPYSRASFVRQEAYVICSFQSRHLPSFVGRHLASPYFGSYWFA